MKWLGLVGGVLAGALAVACGGSEFSSAGETGGSSAGGSSAGGSSGSAAGGSSGSAAGGSSGSAAGGSSGSAAGGSSGNAAGGSSTGGSFPGGNGGGPSGGAGGSTAGAGAGGSAGTGGATGCATECLMGEYCDEDTNKCTSCATIAGRLRFGPPTRVPLNNSTGVDERFPRVADDGTLWYTRGDGGGGYAIVKLSPPYSSAPSVQYQNGSGYIPRGIDGEGLRFDAAFDTKETDGTRKLVGVADNGSLSDLGSLNQIVGANVATLDHSIAVGAGRVWWMSDRVVAGQAGGPHLHTGQPGIVFNINYVPIVLDDDCPAQGPDLTPWVGKAGNLMLLSAQSLSSAGCVTSVDGPKDLYWTLVDNSGQQTGKAKRIELSDPTLDETEPSLSPDLCTIIYARSESTATEAHDLYTATRR
ncbi:MAG: hypothetical protein AB7S68_15560 [Polyangiaceae bacterium]